MLVHRRSLPCNLLGLSNNSPVPIYTQAPIARKVDNAIHWLNHYPEDSVVCFVNTYPLDSDLFVG